MMGLYLYVFYKLNRVCVIFQFILYKYLKENWLFCTIDQNIKHKLQHMLFGMIGTAHHGSTFNETEAHTQAQFFPMFKLIGVHILFYI